MSMGKVLLNLASKGVKYATRQVGSKTVLNYSIGNKSFTQMYNAAGKIEKFKIHEMRAFGDKTIEKGTRTVDSLFNTTTTVRTKKGIAYGMPYDLEKTTVKCTETVPGTKDIEIKTKIGNNSYTTKVLSSKKLDGGYEGNVEKYGIKLDFDTTPKKDVFDLNSTFNDRLDEIMQNYNEVGTNMMVDDYWRYHQRLEQESAGVASMLGILGGLF